MYPSSFYLWRSQKRKKTVKSSVSFCAFGIFARKSCLLNVGEIDTSNRRKSYRRVKTVVSCLVQDDRKKGSAVALFASMNSKLGCCCCCCCCCCTQQQQNHVKDIHSHQQQCTNNSNSNNNTLTTKARSDWHRINYILANSMMEK